MRRKAESGEGAGPADVTAGGSRLGISPCNLCPRECGVDRVAGQMGYCLTDHRVFVARAALHMCYPEGGQGFPSYVGGALHLRGKGFGNGVFFRLQPAVCVLPEL